jgi:hypothetical protein
MVDETKPIEAIVEIMRSCWDLPTDCNEGELFAYAEILCDRIQTGDEREALYAFLADVQTGKMEMPSSDASQNIVDRAIAAVRTN